MSLWCRMFHIRWHQYEYGREPMGSHEQADLFIVGCIRCQHPEARDDGE